MRPGPLLTACLALVVLAGCSSASVGSARPVTATDSTATASEPAAAPAPTIEADVAAGDSRAPGSLVTVTSAGGVLESVALTADGEPVDVEPPVGASWTSPGLAPASTYVVTAVAANAEGGRTELRRTFTSEAPERELGTDVVPWGDQVVGVGHPLTVTLDHPVTGREHRAAVERGLVVTTDRPIGEASWAWISDTVLQFRPRELWPARTRVTLDVDLHGVHAGEGLWGLEDRQVTFRTGRALVVRIDADDHSAVVTRDGEVVRTMDVSLGKDGPGTTTRSGTKVIMSRHESYRMRSETLGPDYGGDSYDLVVPYAMRVTWSGEFLHGADYNSNIGRANTSHGCTNLRSADARWLYENSIVGDPVITTGTDRPMEEGNGLGGVWDVDWRTWTSRSAL